MRKNKIMDLIKKVALLTSLIVCVIIILAQAVTIHSQKKKIAKQNNTIKYYEENFFDEEGHIINERLSKEMQDADEKIAGLEEELRKANEKISELEEEPQVDNSKVVDLEDKLKESEDKIAELRSELQETLYQNSVEFEYSNNSTIEDETFLQIKFPFDGNYYKNLSNDEVIFYADPVCTKKIFSDIRFMSEEIDSSKANNGLNIYCMRMDNGKICYSTVRPYLITETEYNKRMAETDN